MTQNSLVLPGSPLIVCPELVSRLKDNGIKRYATDAAVFIQQLHYFLSMPNHGRVIDGVKWVYNSLTKWQQAIKWLTDYAFRTIRNKLVDLNIIVALQLGLNDQGRDRSYWYSINYDHEIFELEVSPFSTDANCKQSSNANYDNKTSPSCEQSSNHIDTEITPKNTSETTTETPPVAVLKNEISITDEQINECCTQISIVSRDVQLNFQVRSAIASYWVNFPAALQRLKKAVNEKWKCNLTGVLVKALKEGTPQEEVMPIVTDGWKEWVDKAIKRGLINGSSSEGSDLRIYFRDGRASRLWSEIKSLSWEASFWGESSQGNNGEESFHPVLPPQNVAQEVANA